MGAQETYPKKLTFRNRLEAFRTDAYHILLKEICTEESAHIINCTRYMSFIHQTCL